MEAVWKLEDKWKLTTQESLLFFLCTAFAVIGLCTIALLRRKTQRNPKKTQNPSYTDQDPDGDGSNWITIRKVLMGSVRWSGARKWEEISECDEDGGWRGGERSLSFLGMERCESSVGWQSHNSLSPVWQRPILMGEKCELPRFSGLILYDERGRLLDQALTLSSDENINQEKRVDGNFRTTLKDLL